LVREGFVGLAVEIEAPGAVPAAVSCSTMVAPKVVGLSKPRGRDLFFDCWWALFGNRAAGKRP